MHLDSNLLWTLHMEKLLKKPSTAWCMMRILYYLTLDSLKTVYLAHFQSLLQFGIIFWGSTTNLHKALLMEENNKSDVGIKTKTIL